MRTFSARTLLLVVLLVALVLAGALSYYASSSPDGLDRVASDLGFASAKQTSGTNGGPLAGYEVTGLGHARLSGGLAGVIGCLLVLGLSSLLFKLRRAPEQVAAASRTEAD